MARYLTDTEQKAARDAFYGGAEVVGGTEPCREMKWTGWRVIRVDGKLIACVIGSQMDFVCAQEIEPAELPMYTDDDD